MSIQDNKTLVKQCIKFLNQTNPQKMPSHLIDGCSFESMLQQPIAFQVI